MPDAVAALCFGAVGKHAADQIEHKSPVRLNRRVAIAHVKCQKLRSNAMPLLSHRPDEGEVISNRANADGEQSAKQSKDYVIADDGGIDRGSRNSHAAIDHQNVDCKTSGSNLEKKQSWPCGQKCPEQVRGTAEADEEDRRVRLLLQPVGELVDAPVDSGHG